MFAPILDVLITLIFTANLVDCSANRLASRANPAFPNPNVDPFYAEPSNIASYKPGQWIRSRSVPTVIVSENASSYQIFYRTTDTLDNANGTVATVWIPDEPSSPPKIFAYQAIEDAVNLDCAPSWAWVRY